jgi:hypothetical protein
MLYGCSEEDASPYDAEYRTIVLGTNVTLIAGEPSTPRFSIASTDVQIADNYGLQLSGPGALLQSVSLEIDQNVLRITSSAPIRLSDSVSIVLPGEDFNRVVIEQGQEAIVRSYVQEQKKTFSVKAEANSRLTLEGIRTGSFHAVLQDNAHLQLSARAESYKDSVMIEVKNTVQLDDHSVLLPNQQLVTGDSVKALGTGQSGIARYRVYGREIKSFYLTNYSDIAAGASAEMESKDFVIRHMKINLDQKANACVHVKDLLSGSGRAHSSLQYIGSPVVDYVKLEGAVVNKNTTRDGG